MKKSVLSAALAITVSACVPQKKAAVPIPTETMAVKSGHDLAVLRKGFGVYTNQCSRCHEPMMPSEVSVADWHVITPGMAWNAGISDADEAAVLKYILAAK